MIIREFNLPDGRVLRYHEFAEYKLYVQDGKIKYLTHSRETETSPDYIVLYVEVAFTGWSQDIINYESAIAAITNGQLKQYLTTEPVGETLAELKEKKRRDIDDWRSVERYSNTTVPVGGIDYVWQSDSNSQSLISDAVNFAVLGINDPPPVWRTDDNIDVVVTLDDLKNIAGAMAQKTTLAFYRSFQLKQLVEDATTPEQLEEITWSTEI